jgi:hypothetical protein
MSWISLMRPRTVRNWTNVALQNASFLIPVGGLKLCANLMKLSNGRLLVMAGDKVGQRTSLSLTAHHVRHVSQTAPC